jgi:hypothetical protein
LRSPSDDGIVGAARSLLGIRVIRRKAPMNDETLAMHVSNIDRRLERVEQILPTLATKEDLQAFPTKEDLKAYATKEDLKAYATKEDLKAYPTKDDLEAYGARERTAMHAFIADALARQTADIRILLEQERAFLRVVADGVLACTEQLRRVDADSQARDAALDRRVQRLENRE